MNMECKLCCNCSCCPHNECYLLHLGWEWFLASLTLWCVTRSYQHSPLYPSLQRPRLRSVWVAPGSVVMKLTISQGNAGVQQRERCLVQRNWEGSSGMRNIFKQKNKKKQTTLFVMLWGEMSPDIQDTWLISFIEMNKQGILMSDSEKTLFFLCIWLGWLVK